eukprot:11107103-Ditylum_brightwellii.AAC.1
MKHLSSRVVFDDAVIPADERAFVSADWADFYQNMAEEKLPGMPEPCGLPVVMIMFVDADHAGNL